MQDRSIWQQLRSAWQALRGYMSPAEARALVCTQFSARLE
jgi:hypothetical protein